MKKSEISVDISFQYHTVDIGKASMHYLEQGEGDPILFLHTVPASSFSWRKVIPYLSKLGRCIAPDLMGMGKSDKDEKYYSLEAQIKAINQLIDHLRLKNITLVMHGWGSIIGCDYAMKHEKNCKGLVFYEAYLRPYLGDQVSLPFQEQLAMLQNEKNIASLMMDSPYLVDQVLSQELLNTISKEEIEAYRRPFLMPGSAKALYQYYQEMPKGDGKSKADQVIGAYSKALTQSSLPKLMLYSIPGFVATVATLMWAKEHLPNLQLVEVGEDYHFALESHADRVGETISAWLQAIEQQTMLQGSK